MKKLLLAFIAVFALAGCSASATDRLDQTFETDIFSLSYDSVNFTVNEKDMKLYDYEVVIDSNDESSFVAMWTYTDEELEQLGTDSIEKIAQGVVSDSLENFDSKKDIPKKTEFAGHEAYRYSSGFAEVIALSVNDRIYVIIGGSTGDASKADIKTVKATIDSIEFK